MFKIKISLKLNIIILGGKSPKNSRTLNAFSESVTFQQCLSSVLSFRSKYLISYTKDLIWREVS